MHLLGFIRKKAYVYYTYAYLEVYTGGIDLQLVKDVDYCRNLFLFFARRA